MWLRTKANFNLGFLVPYSFVNVETLNCLSCDELLGWARSVPVFVHNQSGALLCTHASVPGLAPVLDNAPILAYAPLPGNAPAHLELIIKRKYEKRRSWRTWGVGGNQSVVWPTFKQLTHNINYCCFQPLLSLRRNFAEFYKNPSRILTFHIISNKFGSFEFL